MKPSVFLDAIEHLYFLGAELIKRLRALCPQLKDEERAEAIAALQSINSDLEQNRKEAVDIAQKNIEIADHARREFMPKIHAAVEEDERAPLLKDLARQMEE